MGSAYAELKLKPERVAEVIRCEEADLLRTIDRGMTHFEDAVQHALDSYLRAEPYVGEAKGAENIKGMLTGQEVFDLYTTFGFPPDLTRQMAAELGLYVDENRFGELMREHA